MLQCSDILRGSVLASDALNLEAGDPEIVELTVGEQGKLTDGLAITHVGTNLRENVGYEHRKLLVNCRPLLPAAFVLAFAVRYIRLCTAEEER